MGKPKDTREAKLARAYKAMKELYRLKEKLTIEKVCSRAGITPAVFKADKRREGIHPDWQTFKDELKELQQKQKGNIENPNPPVTSQLKEKIAEKQQIERDYQNLARELSKASRIALEGAEDLVEIQRLNSHYIGENQSLAEENRLLADEVKNLKGGKKKEPAKSRTKKKKVISLKERREEKKLALERNDPIFLLNEAIEKLSKTEISKYRTKAKRQLKPIKDKLPKEAYEEALVTEFNRLIAEDFDIELEAL